MGFLGGDLNLTAYVWDNPENWGEPEGLSVIAAVKAAAVAMAACGPACAAAAGTIAFAGGVLIGAVITDVMDDVDGFTIPPFPAVPRPTPGPMITPLDPGDASSTVYPSPEPTRCPPPEPLVLVGYILVN